MADFCLDCENKMAKKYGGRQLREEDIQLSKYLTLCEGCSKQKHVMIGYARERPFHSIRTLLQIFKRRKK